MLFTVTALVMLAQTELDTDTCGEPAPPEIPAEITSQEAADTSAAAFQSYMGASQNYLACLHDIHGGNDRTYSDAAQTNLVDPHLDERTDAVIRYNSATGKWMETRAEKKE